MTLATSHFGLCDDVGGRTAAIDDNELGGDLDDASLYRRRPSSRSARLPLHQHHRHKYMPNLAIRRLLRFGDHRSSWSFGGNGLGTITTTRTTPKNSRLRRTTSTSGIGTRGDDDGDGGACRDDDPRFSYHSLRCPFSAKTAALSLPVSLPCHDGDDGDRAGVRRRLVLRPTTAVDGGGCYCHWYEYSRWTCASDLLPNNREPYLFSLVPVEVDYECIFLFCLLHVM